MLIPRNVGVTARVDPDFSRSAIGQTQQFRELGLRLARETVSA